MINTRVDPSFEISSKDAMVIPSCAVQSGHVSTANVTTIFPPPIISRFKSILSIILSHVSQVIIKIGLRGEWRVLRNRDSISIISNYETELYESSG